MKYLLHTFYLLTTLFFITSCGVDRSGEYYALVGDDMDRRSNETTLSMVCPNT